MRRRGFVTVGVTDFVTLEGEIYFRLRCNSLSGRLRDRKGRLRDRKCCFAIHVKNINNRGGIHSLAVRGAELA